MERRDSGPESTESSPEWVNAHEALVAVAGERNLLEAREGKALLWALRSGAHLHLGYGSFSEYVERLFGYSRRTIEDKLRTAVALETLPGIERALALGKMTWSAVRELARVATPATENEWLAATRGKTVREVERLVAGREPGSRPSDVSSPSAQRHVLRFDVAAETLTTFRAAMQKLRRDSGERLDDDSALFLMARYVLGGRTESDAGREGDAGRANYQLTLTRCEQCGRGFQEANGERVEVDAAIMDMAECDAQHVGHVGVVPVDEPTIIGQSGQPHPSVLPETHVGEAEINSDRAGPTHEPTPGRAVCESDGALAHVGAPESPLEHAGRTKGTTPPSVRKRASQTIPPALRRRILRRDTERCVVTGCRHTAYLDLHHIEAKSEGGRHEASNLVTLCGAHHRAVHRGQLIILGRASAELRFTHADGTPYGAAAAARAVDTAEQVFRGLRGLGFKEREAREALNRASAEAGEGTAEELLRAALQGLAKRSTRIEVNRAYSPHG